MLRYVSLLVESEISQFLHCKELQPDTPIQ